jgi:hypothetical protein
VNLLEMTSAFAAIAANVESVEAYSVRSVRRGDQRRQLLGFAVTEHPTAEWPAHQITEAFPWDTAPKYSRP